MHTTVFVSAHVACSYFEYTPQYCALYVIALSALSVNILNIK